MWFSLYLIVQWLMVIGLKALTTYVLGGIIYDIVSLSRMMPRCKFGFMQPEANHLAHSLEKLVKDTANIVLRKAVFSNYAIFFY